LFTEEVRLNVKSAQTREILPMCRVQACITLDYSARADGSPTSVGGAALRSDKPKTRRNPQRSLRSGWRLSNKNSIPPRPFLPLSVT
jgi:hypothetical protein